MTQDLIGRGWAFPPQIGPQGFALTTERNELEQAIQIILATAPGERVMRPLFGCRLHELIFAPSNNQTAVQARRFVEEALGMWEPRINVRKVEVTPAVDDQDQGILRIEIEYQVKTTNDKRSLVFPFYLIPTESTSA